MPLGARGSGTRGARPNDEQREQHAHAFERLRGWPAHAFDSLEEASAVSLIQLFATERGRSYSRHHVWGQLGELEQSSVKQILVGRKLII